jgi:hypothetical protein
MASTGHASHPDARVRCVAATDDIARAPARARLVRLQRRFYAATVIGGSASPQGACASAARVTPTADEIERLLGRD